MEGSNFQAKIVIFNFRLKIQFCPSVVSRGTVIVPKGARLTLPNAPLAALTNCLLYLHQRFFPNVVRPPRVFDL